MTGPLARLLPDGRRLHLNHGPIDLILEGWGPEAALVAARAAAIARFEGILAELVAELAMLRSATPGPLQGPVACRMAEAVAPYRPAFVTPMAAVAGAVAEAVLSTFVSRGGIRRAYANNGGDIAIHLEAGEALTAAIAARPGLPDRLRVHAADPVRGIASSGWGGRSFSLGIADTVTVLAHSAPAADAAATMIANAVDLPGHPGIRRMPARLLQEDSDLGALPVTVGVAPLAPAEIAQALDRGAAFARDLASRSLIAAAALFLQGETRVIGAPALDRSPFDGAFHCPSSS